MKKYRQDYKGSNRQTGLNVAQPEELMKFLIEKMPDKNHNWPTGPACSHSGLLSFCQRRINTF